MGFEALLTVTGEGGGMKHLLGIALLMSAAPVAAAERNFGVSGFDRVRVDGNYRVTLTTGVAPFAKASGDSRAIDAVTIRVEGRTLVVRPSQSQEWGGYPGAGRGTVTIAIGTHDLTSAQLNGSGSLSINRVKGLKFDATAAGAGMLSIEDVAVDQLTLGLAGAASARLAGATGKLNALVRGMSVMDGERLSAKDATILADGPATVRATVTGTAKVTAAGVGSVALAGNPSCELSVRGSADVSGCKGSPS